MANVVKVYRDSQVTTDRIRAEAAVQALAVPARVVNVFGTASDVAPNFTTVSGALTYANSLTPIVTEPVVIRLFAKADGTPYDLTGLSSWTTYANQYIYFESDFVRLNETTTLPTTLPAGKEVWYVDANGVETLWVGRENGSAWPSVGYKEIVLNGISASSIDDYYTATNSIGATITTTTSLVVTYPSTSVGKIMVSASYKYDGEDSGNTVGANWIKGSTSVEFTFWDGAGNSVVVFPSTMTILVRIYP